MLIRRARQIVLSTFLGLLLIYAGFAIFTARLALYPWWYRHADVGIKLPVCSSYQQRVYEHCYDPKAAFALEFSEFKADPVTVPAIGEPIGAVGWVVKAPHSTSLKGTVILVHGGGADRRAMLKHTKYLHDGGYHVLLIDCHNHGLNKGDSAGLSFGYRESASVVATAEWAAKNLAGAAGKPVVAMGTSQGAFAALKAATESPLISAVIAENPYISVRRLLREFPSLSWEPKIVKEGAFLLLSAWLRYPVGELDVRTFASRLANCPVFLIHGKADTIVSSSHSEDIAGLLTGRKELWLIEGGEHEFLWNKFKEDYSQRVLEFLAALAGASTGEVQNKL